MKKQLPLLLSMVVGILAIATFYIPAISEVEDTLVGWAQVLAAAALILGGINIVQVNYPKIRRREEDWPYKVVLLGSAAIMLLAGIPWHRLGGAPEPSRVEVATAIDPALQAAGRAQLVVTGEGSLMVSVDGAVAQPASVDGVVQPVTVTPGKHTLRVFAGATDYLTAGYTRFDGAFELAAGQTASAEVHLTMQWGLDGRVFKWLYDYVFDPCNSTMFALLAFFIASAAFRAFRARNVEAALLLIAAILVMLGRVPIGRLLSESFPYIADWLVDVPNNAGRRAIMMGAALGAVATGLRVILGLERSHLGSD